MISLDEFIYLRSEIRGHHEMVNHRMSWFAASQSLLFGAYASAAVPGQMHWFSERLVPIVGLLLCVLMIPAVESAFERIKSLRVVLKWVAPQFKAIYPINPDRWHHAAHLYPRLAPWIFLGAWFVVLAMNVRVS